MKLRIIKKLPKRKEIQKRASPLFMAKDLGFNECYDEIETVEVTEEELERFMRHGEIMTGKRQNYKQCAELIIKAIMKIGGGDE